MTLIWPFKVTKGKTYHAIRTTTYDFLYGFFRNYSAISNLENVGIEEIMKIHKTQSTSTNEHLWNRELTWFFVVTRTCSYEEHQIMDSSTSKAFRMQKEFTKKGFFIFIFSISTSEVSKNARCHI